MHDIKAIRDNPDRYAAAWASKGLSSAVDEVLKLDDLLRGAKTVEQGLLERKNSAAKDIGKLVAQLNRATREENDDEVRFYTSLVEQKKREAGAEGAIALAGASETTRDIELQLRDKLSSLPNLPADDVPPGEDEHGNVEQRRWGSPRNIEAPKDHVDLGAPIGMDFEAAAKMSGARFVVLKGQMARLERAIGQFMLDVQTTEHGYTEVSPPLLVRDDAMFGTGQLPKFEEDLFSTQQPRDLFERSFSALRKALSDDRAQASKVLDVTYENGEGYRFDTPTVMALVEEYLQEEPPFDRRFLIPTAEVSLTNIVREAITAAEELPLRLTALTPSFRAEAGSAGRDTRGMIRQHQFYKVELVSITTPDESDAEHERMTQCAEAVLQKLELPYRTMLLCAGDMGFGARKTYDLEVWLPSQGMYREISSCSNCGDFQARRMDARFKKAGEKGTSFVHTLNGSGLAVGRTLVAVMENYQQADGSIAIPAVLQPYMGGLTAIGGR